MAYMVEAVERAASRSGVVSFLGGGVEERVPWSDLYGDATALARTVTELGVGPGQSLVVLGLTSRPAVVAALAGWLAGASVTFAPTPARPLTEAEYVEATKRRLDALGAPLVLVGPPWEQLCESLAGRVWRVCDLRSLLDAALRRPRRPWTPPAVSSESTAVTQLTSGTTGDPKIIRLSHANLTANVEAIKRAVGHDEVHGRMYSWLPLSHDMGLVGGLVMPLSCGSCDVVLSSPLEFLTRPGAWMRNVARLRATATVGPNSAFAMASKFLTAVGPPLDLSCLRVALVGGEAVDPEIMDAFVAAGKRHGLDPGVVLPAYGLAEATVAVTMSPLGRGLRCDVVDTAALADRQEAVPAPQTSIGTSADVPAPGGETTDVDRSSAPVRRLSFLGFPVEGMAVRVVDPAEGAELPERRVGEIQVQGPSVADRRSNDLVLTAGRWLRTGDLGYLADGELVVTGRMKDVIVLAGRNIYPEEVERAAAQVSGVRPGNVVAFSHRRAGPFGVSEGLALAVESRLEDPEAIRLAVLTRVMVGAATDGDVAGLGRRLVGGAVGERDPVRAH